MIFVRTTNVFLQRYDSGCYIRLFDFIECKLVALIYYIINNK